MSRKFLFLLILWFALGITQYACNDCPDTNMPTQFWVKEIGAEVNYYYGYGQDSTAFYHHDSIFLSILVKEATFAARKHFTILNEAMACDPIVPRSDDKLRSIYIVASEPANDSGSIQLLKGDTLNKYFNTRNNSGDFIVPMDTLNSFYSAIDWPNQTWQLKWNTKPNKPLLVSVDVFTRLTTGKEFSTKNLKLRLR
jgi:hypothetical protein